MATIEDYWKQVTTDPKWEDLDDKKREVVRQRLFDQVVRGDQRYLGLAQTKREEVKKRFDDVTRIEPETMFGSLKKSLPKIEAAGKQALETGKEVGKKVVEGAKKGYEGYQEVRGMAELGAETLMPAPIKAGWEGVQKGAAAVTGAIEKAGDAIEPSEERLGKLAQDPAMTAFGALTSPMTQYDLARAFASGAVKTAGKFIDTMVPKTYVDMAEYAMLDGVFKVMGKTPLGWRIPGTPDFVRPPKKSAAKNPLADGSVSQLITKELLEHEGRNSGNARPLEVLAREEAKVQAQKEIDGYEEWLKQADDTSARGGEPAGDLHPEAKVNVSQLRDAAKERLKKLQGEPVRLQSLRMEEDDLGGYYRRRVAAFPRPGDVIPLPESSVPASPKPGMLPEGPKPAGLLTGGRGRAGAPTEVPKAAPKAPTETSAGAGAQAPVPSYRAKDVLTKMYAAYSPGETKQAIDIRTGALLKQLGIKPTEELSQSYMTMLEKLLEAEHADLAAKQPVPKEVPHVVEKGIDPADVKLEAKRLQAEDEATRGISDIEQFIQQNGGLKMNPADPSGRIPEKEEFQRNVPIHLRGRVNADQMAQSLFEAGLQEDASSSTMYRKLSERKTSGPRRSLKSYMDEAEDRLYQQRKYDAGLVEDAPKFGQTPKKAVQQDLLAGSQEDLVLRGEEGATGGSVSGTGEQAGIPGTEAKFPDKPLADITQRDGFDLARDFFEGMGEKGQIGGEIDPEKVARRDAAIRELTRRAMAIGYKSTEDIMLWMAKNAPAEIRDSIRKELSPTVTPFDTHAYKEMDAAKAGQPAAQKSLTDRATREYLQEKQSWLKGKLKKLKANQQVLMFKDGDEALMHLKNELFVHDNYRLHNKYELAAQRWYNEGKAPKLDALANLVGREEAEKMLDAFHNPTDRMKAAKGGTQAKEDEWYDLFSEFYDQMGYVENHVTRRWKQPKEYLNWEGYVLKDTPNFVRGRKIITQADGINAGMIPETMDIRDDLRASNNQRLQLLSRIHMLRKIGMTLETETGLPSIIDESTVEGTQATKANVAVMKGQAPANWLRYRNAPLLRDMAINPEYKLAIDHMLSRKSNTPAAEFMDWLVHTGKGNFFAGSMFHHFSLTEMLLTGSSWRDLFSFNMNRNLLAKTVRRMSESMKLSLENPLTWKPPTSKANIAENVASIGKWYESFMRGAASLSDRPLALDMAEHRFRFGPINDETQNMVSRNLRSIEDWLTRRLGDSTLSKSLKAPLKLARTVNDIHQKFLWSYVHESFSMAIYENQLADNIRKFHLEAPEGKKMPIDAIKSETLDFVTKEMGGISYAKLFVTPHMQQVLQWLLLAPAWTIGRVWMGAEVVMPGPQGRQARKQAIRMALAYYVSANLANYAQTKKHLGTGRFLWDNPKEQKLNIFWKLKDNQEFYVQGSKASTEIVDDITHPARTMAGKASPPIQAGVKIFNWAKTPDGIDRFDAANPLKALAPMFTPGSGMINGMSAYGSLPVRKGVTKGVISQYLSKYYETGDRSYFEDAKRFGREAGINVRAIDQFVKGRYHAKIRKERMASRKQEDLLR